MRNLYERMRKAKAKICDQSLPEYRRVTETLQSLGGLELTGLPNDVRSTLEKNLVAVNRILADYTLETPEDYERLENGDLRRILSLIETMTSIVAGP